VHAAQTDAGIAGGRLRDVSEYALEIQPLEAAASRSLVQAERFLLYSEINKLL